MRGRGRKSIERERRGIGRDEGGEGEKKSERVVEGAGWARVRGRVVDQSWEGGRGVGRGGNSREGELVVRRGCQVEERRGTARQVCSVAQRE